MDPRIEWMPDPLVRLNATKAMSMGLVNLTERFAKGGFGGSFFFLVPTRLRCTKPPCSWLIIGIEQSTLFGDPMDSGVRFYSSPISPIRSRRVEADLAPSRFVHISGVEVPRRLSFSRQPRYNRHLRRSSSHELRGRTGALRSDSSRRDDQVSSRFLSLSSYIRLSIL